MAKRAAVATGNTLLFILFLKTLKTVCEGSAVESMTFTTRDFLGGSVRHGDCRLRHEANISEMDHGGGGNAHDWGVHLWGAHPDTPDSHQTQEPQGRSRAQPQLDGSSLLLSPRAKVPHCSRWWHQSGGRAGGHGIAPTRDTADQLCSFQGGGRQALWGLTKRTWQQQLAWQPKAKLISL